MKRLYKIKFIKIGNGSPQEKVFHSAFVQRFINLMEKEYGYKILTLQEVK